MNNMRIAKSGVSISPAQKPSDAAYSYPSKNQIRNGLSVTNSIASARNALKKGFVVKSHDNKLIRFNSNIYDKYKFGVSRGKAPQVSLDLSSSVNDIYTPKGKPDPGRLIHLGKAVTAVKKANAGRFILKNDSPPQIAYLHQFSKRNNMVVFVDAKTKVVRGMISVKNIQKWKNDLQSRS